jgi:hypothetical protein
VLDSSFLLIFYLKTQGDAWHQSASTAGCFWTNAAYSYSFTSQDSLCMTETYSISFRETRYDAKIFCSRYFYCTVMTSLLIHFESDKICYVTPWWRYWSCTCLVCTSRHVFSSADATAWCNVFQTEDDGFSFSKQKYITGYAIDVDTQRFELCIVYEVYQIGPPFNVTT